MHLLLGNKDRGGQMSMKIRKKNNHKRNAGSDSVERQAAQPETAGFGRTLADLLDRTRAYLMPAQKADT
jgi:hypothetical protein